MAPPHFDNPRFVSGSDLLSTSGIPNPRSSGNSRQSSIEIRRYGGGELLGGVTELWPQSAGPPLDFDHKLLLSPRHHP